MADFTIPFGRDGERRLPTTTEREQGFLCGSADRALFSALFHRLESEVGDVVSYAGITPTDAQFTTLRQAILALIGAATGGNPAGYILMSQARARLPIHPEILTVDGRVTITQPSTGVVRLPGGVNFLHRGIEQFTTSQIDFATDPSKTYHIRWDPTNGFRQLDLASATYNPSSLSETSKNWDSSYDDMFVARVVTNSSNVAEITSLANKNLLKKTLADSAIPVAGTNHAYSATYNFALNWARTPEVSINSWVWADSPDTATGVHGGANIVFDGAQTVSRYGIVHVVTTDWAVQPYGLWSRANGFAIA